MSLCRIGGQGRFSHLAVIEGGDPRDGADVTGIKLAKLPDRTPVKLTISLAPDLLQALACYQAFSRGLAARILASLSMAISRTTFFRCRDHVWGPRRLWRRGNQCGRDELLRRRFQGKIVNPG